MSLKLFLVLLIVGFAASRVKQPKFEYTGTIFITSAWNQCLCLTRDSFSGSNQSHQMILHDYCAYRKKTWRARNWKPKLEIAKIAGSEYYLLSQAHRESGKPYGLAGCLKPTNSGLFFDVAECTSDNSHWSFNIVSDGRIQVIHRNSRKCLQPGNDNVSVSLADCARHEVKQQWVTEINKD